MRKNLSEVTRDAVELADDETTRSRSWSRDGGMGVYDGWNVHRTGLLEDLLRRLGRANHAARGASGAQGPANAAHVLHAT